MRWTEQHLRDYEARNQPQVRQAVSDPSAGSEAALQDAIAAECRRRGWPFINPRRDRETTIAVGAPDFVIAASLGRTFWIECKVRNGKQSTEQRGFEMLLSRQKHTYHLVRTFQEALDIFDA